MSDIICITNRRICTESFLMRIGKIAACRPKAIVLREKDLTEDTYLELAKQVMEVCSKYDTQCILHSFVNAAKILGADSIHLPLHVLSALGNEDKQCFKTIGASCHSAEDARLAEQLGASYITAGHIFVTDCKKGLAPRGLDFLESVIQSVSIPVYAIGGIHPEHVSSIRQTGASGSCVMSGLMQCSDPAALLKEFEGISENIAFRGCHEKGGK